MQRPPLEKPDIDEKGANHQRSDRRLFMQLLAFGGCRDIVPLVEALGRAGFDAVLYEDLHDPFGVALLTMSSDPGFFVGPLRRFIHESAFASLVRKPEYTMFGRTYSLGYERDLEETLFTRPRTTALNADWPWAVWYPLRRSGQFEQLPDDQQREVLMEHGRIGMAFGRADYAHDIRLACQGLDTHDNDFVIGLLGPDLYPLSSIVQAMRHTTQTSLYLERLGPFFVGRVACQASASGGRSETADERR